MKRIYFILIILISCIEISLAQSNFVAGELKISIDNKGYFTEIKNTKTGINYLSKDTISPFITLICNDKRHLPKSFIQGKSKDIFTLNFAETDIKIDIKITIKKTHLTLEIIKAEPSNNIEGIVWGPIPLTISKTIGEIIGVVRDDKVAVGLQVLNIKTDGGDYSKEGASYSRGQAAVAKNWGSNIQAFSINREIPRFVDTWCGENKKTPVPIIKGENVVGSKIAFFSCNEISTLDLIEKIELAEGLPHPMVNGVWTHKLYRRGHSYMISDFTEANVDKMIVYTKRAGLISLYHPGPFNNWGHYDLDTSYFPHGITGLKECATKAKTAGIHLGVHTLTNFINTNDAYVSPIPDFRLALTGFGFLTENIDVNTTEIPVSTNEYFKEEKGNNLHSVKIGNEIIQYKNVSSTFPFKLLDCQRGAFGTQVSSHSKNDTVGKLYDHAYKVFFPNIDLQREIAINLANIFNETGVDHLDFDGFEGAWASGQGDYALNLFADDFYKHLNHTVLNGTSMSKTYYWHINTFCNWGEPWYGGFKESMQEYRINNQLLFDRNLMPHMLGWYLLTKNTSKSEMEWMLARAAGYDAGFAMVSGQKSIEDNPFGLELLDLIREWETARLGLAFSDEQRERLKDAKNEFHLEKIKEGGWNLFQYHFSKKYIHENKELQPGEPTSTLWNYTPTDEKQAFQFKLYVSGNKGKVYGAEIWIDNYIKIEIPFEIESGQTLICDGSTLLRLYDVKGKQISTYTLKNITEIDKGNHQILFDSKFSKDADIVIEFTIKSLGATEKISLKQ